MAVCHEASCSSALLCCVVQRQACDALPIFLLTSYLLCPPAGPQVRTAPSPSPPTGIHLSAAHLEATQLYQAAVGVLSAIHNAAAPSVVPTAKEQLAVAPVASTGAEAFTNAADNEAQPMDTLQSATASAPAKPVTHVGKVGADQATEASSAKTSSATESPAAMDSSVEANQGLSAAGNAMDSTAEAEQDTAAAGTAMDSSGSAQAPEPAQSVVAMHSPAEPDQATAAAGNAVDTSEPAQGPEPAQDVVAVGSAEQAAAAASAAMDTSGADSFHSITATERETTPVTGQPDTTEVTSADMAQKNLDLVLNQVGVGSSAAEDMQHDAGPTTETAQFSTGGAAAADARPVSTGDGVGAETYQCPFQALAREAEDFASRVLKSPGKAAADQQVSLACNACPHRYNSFHFLPACRSSL